MLSDKVLEAIEILGIKEQLLGDIIVWLKDRDLWEECKKSLSIKIKKSK